jgi:glycosyltransferase involved in cell wall biosynthesis
MLNLNAFNSAPAIPANAPRIAMVTPSYNHAQYLGAAIDSILSQAYPNLYYHVQDGASIDGTVDLLKNRGDSVSWKSEPD